LAQTLNPAWLNTATFVPIPGSKMHGDPNFDDRLERKCRALGAQVDVRILVRQMASTVASHE
jgi:hypothetical protein